MVYTADKIKNIVKEEFSLTPHLTPGQFRIYIFFMVNSGMILFNDTRISSDVLEELMIDLKYEGLNYHQCERAIRYSFKGYKYPSKYYRNISPSLRKEVLERDGYKCVYCSYGRTLQIDHIVAWSFGGYTELYNLQVLCARCNQITHNN